MSHLPSLEEELRKVELLKTGGFDLITPYEALVKAVLDIGEHIFSAQSSPNKTKMTQLDMEIVDIRVRKIGALQSEVRKVKGYANVKNKLKKIARESKK